GSDGVTISAYLDALGARLRVTPWRRRRILDEARDHLEEAAARERARGLEAPEAEARAVVRFGDADLIAREFTEALRGPSHGRAIALLWVSVSAACAASVAMTWRRAEPSPQIIALAEGARCASPFYRARPPAASVLARPRSTFPRAPASVPPPAPPAEMAPTPASPPPPESFAHLVALALPPPPGTFVRVTPPPERITPPVPLQTRAEAAIRYPREGRRMAVEGDVILRRQVDAAGRVDDAEGTRPLGYGLDEVALDVARGLRFRPATDERGEPRAATVNWTVHCARVKEPLYAVPVFESWGQ